MNRTTSLTLLLMMGSVAAAVAAPEAVTPAELLPTCCAQVQQGELATESRAQRDWRLAVAPQRAAPVRPCSDDVTAAYRHWHHGSEKLVPGCERVASKT